MWPFRRRREETLNEILLREAGLDRPQPEPLDPYAGTYPAQRPGGTWTRAMARPSVADAIVTVHAPLVLGTSVEFVTLPGGDLIVDEEQGDVDLSPLAEAVERQLQPPYRARARREEGDLWGVSARGIDVRRFTCDLGDELDLVMLGGTETLTAGGEPADGQIPELERAGAVSGPDYAVHAERLDGDFWEVRAAAL